MPAIPKFYNHKEVEPRLSELWEKGHYFSPQIDPAKNPFSIFLVPPNASGSMHIGNVLMIALQDILVRCHRAKGEPTLWIPSTDHGGYETQVTFERELEKKGKNRSQYSSKELFSAIEIYVNSNNEKIKKQIRRMGASVDWSRFRFTLDTTSSRSTDTMFRKMAADNLIYRHSYMVNYCALCGTMLADIELHEEQKTAPLYFVKFPLFEKENEYVALATTRPEFLFATTHVRIQPEDKRFAHHIGKILRNPITGMPVEVIADKRKFDPENPDPFLVPFSPSYKKFDYEYTLRNPMPSRNLLDWEGKMIERHPGLTPTEAREREAAFLHSQNLIEKTDESYTDSIFLCKSGHNVETRILLTWFLKIDDERASLRKPALEHLQKGELTVLPQWREKGLIGWLEKMHDWPIARQNVWGIKIPIWYDVSDPSLFTVWFRNKAGERHYGNLKGFLENGVSFDEIADGLERIYAEEKALWTLEKKDGVSYLPETDTFDTWFSSGDWSVMVYGDIGSPDFNYFYPNDSLIIGYDLLRLCVAREIFLGLYMTGKLPFRTVYFHRLIKGSDGQKMSKSLGNAVDPEEIIEQFGADVFRMALVSYSHLQDDFIFDRERLSVYQKFSRSLWNIGQLISSLPREQYNFSTNSSPDVQKLLDDFAAAVTNIESHIEKFSFASAQERACKFLWNLEGAVQKAMGQRSDAVPLSFIRTIFGYYLTILHPFMPFMTEELYIKIYSPEFPLAYTAWPNKQKD